MKAEELMHNDWYSGLNCNNERDNFRFDINDIVFWDDCEPQPIPLTEDMLIKLGFVKNNKEYDLYVEDGDWHFILYIDEENRILLPIANDYTILKYCHQLQQALRLTGLSELADNGPDIIST